MHVSPLHYIIFLCLRSVFDQTKWHAQWDPILLPSSLHFNGRQKKDCSFVVVVYDWTMLALKICLVTAIRGKDSNERKTHAPLGSKENICLICICVTESYTHIRIHIKGLISA